MFRRTRKDRDGQYLVRLCDGEVHLGTFYCGEFVMDGYGYNETAGMISDITHIQAVKPPNNPDQPQPK